MPFFCPPAKVHRHCGTTKWFVPLCHNLGKKNCEFSGEQIRAICDLVVSVAESLGTGTHMEFNAVMDARATDAKENGVKLTTKRKKLLQNELCNTSEEAAPMHTLDKIKADIYALEQESESLLERIIGEAEG